jgi:hypothetical protein
MSTENALILVIGALIAIALESIGQFSKRSTKWILHLATALLVLVVASVMAGWLPMKDKNLILVVVLSACLLLALVYRVARTTEVTTHLAPSDKLTEPPRAAEDSKPATQTPSEKPKGTDQPKPHAARGSSQGEYPSIGPKAGSDAAANIPTVESITFVQQRIASPRKEFPFGLSVTLQTNVSISPVRLRISCTGPIGEGHVRFAGPVSAMFGVVTTVRENDFEFSIANPPFTPESPLVVTLFAATPISVATVTHVY